MFTTPVVPAWNSKLLLIGLCISLFAISASYAQSGPSEVYQSHTLKVNALTTSTYVHISYLQTNSFGRVACNGMIVVNKKEAIIFDTPANDSTSYELIDFVENKLKCKIKAVVINHFHEDCLGGLRAFHARGVASYASNKTIELAGRDNVILPQNGFDTSLILNVGNQKVINTFFGEGHTRDNIVSYFPAEQVLFGGCLIKELNAGKGNLADANTSEWANTVAKVAAAYPRIQYVVPGHGKPGDQKLLTYTIQLFQ